MSTFDKTLLLFISNTLFLWILSGIMAYRLFMRRFYMPRDKPARWNLAKTGTLTVFLCLGIFGFIVVTSMHNKHRS